RPVFVDRDLDWDDVAALGFRRGVVLLAEVHDVDAVRAERGADGRRRGSLAGRQLHLDNRGDSSPPWRHDSLFLFLVPGCVYLANVKSWRPGRRRARRESPGRRSTPAP